jgi:RecA/RadA recombinase
MNSASMPADLQALREIHPLLGTVRNLAQRARREPPRKSRVEVLDALLDGGFEPGQLIELVGSRSSGRFSALVQTLATFTRSGEVAALVDLGNGFDPRSAAAAGIDLSRLLWARPPHMKSALIATELLLNTGFPLVVLDLGSPPVPGGRGPEASWMRLARAAQKRQSILLVSSPYRASGTTAQAIIEANRGQARWSGSGRAPRILDALCAEWRLAKAVGRGPTPPRSLAWQSSHGAP